ncbi:MAG TPA: hypothetical protein ENI76_00445 [Ignavibacteria bacterium]|nr:hypothetical protein [Ignavibacteria bacterium]
MKQFFKYVIQKNTLKKSIQIALLVGTILALINHAGAIFNWNLNATMIFQIVLDYFVPFGVASYSAAMELIYANHVEKREKNDI